MVVTIIISVIIIIIIIIMWGKKKREYLHLKGKNKNNATVRRYYLRNKNNTTK